MSQSMTEGMSKWSPEECRENLHLLPKLLDEIQSAESLDKQLENIQLLCTSFVPVIDLEALETLLLCELMQKIRENFKNNLEGVGSVIEAAEESMVQVQMQLQAHLQCSIEVLASLNKVVEYLSRTEAELELGHYSSLPPVLLEVVQTSYVHCKESSNIYGDCISIVSDHLSDLFKKAHSLLMIFLSLVDKTKYPTNTTESEVEALCHIIYSTFEISEVASLLDKKIMLTLWKALSRWCCQHKALLFNRLDIGSMLSSLANDMVESLQYLFVQEDNDEKSFVRKVKVIGFQMKVLVKLVKEYEGGLVNCVPSITNLLLQILKNVPPNVGLEGLPANYLSEFQQQVVTAVEPLLHCLVENHEFCTEITKTECSDDSSCAVARLLVILQILDILPNYSEELQRRWTQPDLNPEDTPRISILQSAFREFSRAYAASLLPIKEPYLLPGIMCGGKPQRMVTLFEYTCERICAFLACIPHELFPTVEDTLFTSVLGNNLQTAMLAIDAWCFIVRYGTADLCRDHVFMAANLIASSEMCSLPQYTHLCVLFRRLLHLTAPEHRMDFVEKFPVRDHLQLWSLTPLSYFNTSAAKELIFELTSCCTNCVRKWLDKSSYTPSDVHSLKVALACLTNLHESGASSGTSVLESAQSQTVTDVVEILTLLQPHVIADCSLLQSLVAGLIKLSSHLIRFMDDHQLWSVFSTAKKILGFEPNVDIKLHILELLAAFSTRQMSKSTEETEAVSLIPVIFSTLLQDKCCVVHNVSLQTFADFAQTCHESIVTDTLKTSGKLEEVVSAFFNQVAYGILFEPKLEEMRQQADMMKTFHEFDVTTVVPEVTWPSEPLVMRDTNTNRADLDSKTVRSFDHRGVLASLKKCVGDLESQKQKEPLPEWATAELLIVKNRLSALLT